MWAGGAAGKQVYRVGLSMLTYSGKSVGSKLRLGALLSCCAILITVLLAISAGSFLGDAVEENWYLFTTDIAFCMALPFLPRLVPDSDSEEDVKDYRRTRAFIIGYCAVMAVVIVGSAIIIFNR